MFVVPYHIKSIRVRKGLPFDARTKSILLIIVLDGLDHSLLLPTCSTFNWEVEHINFFDEVAKHYEASTVGSQPSGVQYPMLKETLTCFEYNSELCPSRQSNVMIEP